MSLRGLLCSGGKWEGGREGSGGRGACESGEDKREGLEGIEGKEAVVGIYCMRE